MLHTQFWQAAAQKRAHDFSNNELFSFCGNALTNFEITFWTKTVKNRLSKKYLTLVFVFSFTLFRDINESNELKLQLFHKQLALEFQFIKQLSRFHDLAVSINIKYRST